MPVRKMTDEEVEKIFGGGLVIFGQPQPKASTQPDGNPPAEGSSHVDEADGDDDCDDESEDSGQQRNLDQEEHDRRMLAMSDEKRRRMVKGLGDLVRRRMGEQADALRNDPDQMQQSADAIEEALGKRFLGK